ncbi:MAG: DNA topoisomerase VI subunit B [Candidatus Latescibacterota bacterium]
MAGKRKSHTKSAKPARKGRADALDASTTETLPLFADAEPGSGPVQEPETRPDRVVMVAAKSKPSGADKGAGPAARNGGRARQTAQSIALRQREISVSEFFAKNRHMLGFDSPTRALLTAIKEAVDNSLDACEEAGYLPDIRVQIEEIGENRYRTTVADSGPGIVKSQVPKIFGKLLYGSKFHELKQSRGQQGIGISAAVMYSQLTTGKPVRVTTRTGPRKTANVYDLQIDTKKNAPIVLDEGQIEWGRDHGTRVQMEIEASYKKGKRSVDSYIHQVALANPHAEITYQPPKGDPVVYKRLTNELPVEPVSIKPHPYGVELGILIDMLATTKSRNVKGFLSAEFSRMSPRAAQEILDTAGIKPKTSPRRVNRDQAEAMIKAFGKVKLMKPPTNCLSVIGDDLMIKSLEREVDADFYSAVTRPPAVYRGNPFQVEVALAYGGNWMASDEIIQLYRFANRAPLTYQQSACAITQSVIGTAWRNYGINQSKGALPTAPMVVMVQISSVWVPFTSESKEAVAHYPDIIKEIKLALQECGRQLARFIRKGARERDEAKKRSYIEQYIPHIGIALQEILGFPEQEEQKIVSKLKDTLERSRKH